MNTERSETLTLLLAQITDKIKCYQTARANNADVYVLRHIKKELYVLWEEVEKIRIAFIDDLDKT